MSAGRKVLRYTLVVAHPDSGAATAILAGKPVPKWASKLVLEDDLVADEDEDGDDDPGEQGIEGMKVPELKAEIERRNADREDDAKLSLEGNKPELVATLQVDDAAIAAAASA